MKRVNLCLTGCESSLSALAHRFEGYEKVELHEIRLDLIRHLDESVFDLIRRYGNRLIATCRRAKDGGRYEGPESERLEILRRCGKAGAAWIDVELDVLESDPKAVLDRGSAKLIASYHDIRVTQDLDVIISRFSKIEADLLKIAVTIHTAADLLALRRIRTCDPRPMVLIGMGEAGLWTRVRPHDFGSAWTYVASQAGPTAPGQPALDRALRLRVLESIDLEPIALIGGAQVVSSPGPDVYNTIFASKGISYQYLPLPAASPDEVFLVCQAFKIKRASVTMPLKRALLGHIRELDTWSKRVGSVNTIVDDGALHGYNTDAIAALTSLGRCAAPGGKVLVLGGGASAVTFASLAATAGYRVLVQARNPSTVLLPHNDVKLMRWGEAVESDVVVNCTPLGTDGETNAWCGPPPKQGVIDLAILKGRDTPLIASAKQNGLKAISGLDFWCCQGAAQVSILTQSTIEEYELFESLRDLGWLPQRKRRRVRSISAPGSKSLTQRYLILSAIANSPSHLVGVSEGQDSKYLGKALCELGTMCAFGAQDAMVVPLPFRRPEAPIEVGEGGTTARFISALALATGFPFAIRLRGRLTERPMDALWDALRRAGTHVRFTQDDGLLVEFYRTQYHPLVSVDMSVSSQFASALALVAPALPEGLHITLTGAMVSRAYLDMTIETLREFGVDVTVVGNTIDIRPGRPDGRCLEVEGDWSLAAFFLAASRITGRDIRITNIRKDSLQGDRIFPKLLATLDSSGDHRFDLRDVPDLLPPLVIAALFAKSPTVITGLRHARLKESDRLSVLSEELLKIGASIIEIPDGLLVEPAPLRGPARLDPRQDHRMAMAFGILSLVVRGIEVANPECVSKSYPRFWKDLEVFMG